jgi:acetyl esterase/lipase
MRTRLWRLGAAVLLACAGLLRAQGLQPEVAANVVTQDHYPPGQPVFPRGVRGLPGLSYTSSPDRSVQALDLYLPPGSTATPRPLVVFIHGGAWLGGSRRLNGAFVDWPGALAALAARGFVVASIDYRLAPAATFPAQVQDVKQAVRWLRSQAGVYGIDRSRVLVWGAEAGGHLAALAAASCGAASLEPPARTVPPNPVIGSASRPPAPADESACANAAVVWYGAADLTRLASMPEAGAFLGCGAADCTPQRRLASPVTYIDGAVPPFLVIHGMEDLFFPVSQAALLNGAIRARNGSVELILLPGVGRDFIGRDPEDTRAASQRAWQRTVDFIERTLRPR